MAVAHKGAISFGLVHIPIQMYKTTQEVAISFHQLCKETHARVKYKKYCANCEKELKADDIIKGYQYEKDNYVIMSNDEIEALKGEKDRTIHILHFSAMSDIDPIYYEKNYYAIPEKHAEKAYELLYQTMKKKKVVAIAQTIIGTKETLLALCPEDDGILVKTLFYKEEIALIPKALTHPKVLKEELGMAEKLIDSMMKEYDPSLYQDEFQEKLRAAIEAKINGNKVVQSSAKDTGSSNAIDLMEALQQSIAGMKKAKPKRSRSVH